ncbi:MAG TPA: VOC family protein [Patescibacteria group bacterium]|jgi:predicted metalloenzyme YecM|nr:VOC family protein [Patescibacteria group bacterium]
MINPERLQQLLPAFAEEAKLFFYSYGLAELVIDLPVDHVAIKALDREVYEEYLKMYAPLATRVSFEKVNDRDLACAVLKEPLDAGTFGQVTLLEIMEPRPGAIATTHDLIDHIELLVPDLKTIQDSLDWKEVQYTEQSNDNHSTLVIEINEWGQEVKFTARSLQDIVDAQLKAGSSKLYTSN